MAPRHHRVDVVGVAVVVTADVVTVVVLAVASVAVVVTQVSSYILTTAMALVSLFRCCKTFTTHHSYVPSSKGRRSIVRGCAPTIPEISIRSRLRAGDPQIDEKA